MTSLDPDAQLIMVMMDRRLADRDMIRRLLKLVRYQSELIAVLMADDDG